MIMDTEDDMRVAAQATNRHEALEAVAVTACDVVLMDVRMPRLDGVAATRELIARNPHGPKVLVLTTFDRDEHAFAAPACRSSGFLLKHASAEDVLAALSARCTPATPSSRPRPGGCASTSLPTCPSPGRRTRSALTDRERALMVENARGATNGEIASRLFLAEPR
jgi:DNA-binding NarL/FixJ family response regulator